MGRILSFIFVFCVLCVIGVAIYAVFADLSAPKEMVEIPVELGS